MNKIPLNVLWKLFSEFQSSIEVQKVCTGCEFLDAEPERYECTIDDRMLECTLFRKWLREVKHICPDCEDEHFAENKDDDNIRPFYSNGT